MPSQPAFCVQLTTETDVAIDADTTLTWGTEKFDQGSNFSSTTFTAPVDGKYQFNVYLSINNLDVDHDYFQVHFITTKVNFYNVFLIDPGGLSGDPTYWGASGSILAEMDANDTCIVQVRGVGGAAVTDIANDSFFSGFLAC